MIELEFLKEQNVSESLIHGIEEFRKNYNVDDGAAARVTRPSIPFYGKEILEMASAGLLEGENLLLAGPKATWQADIFPYPYVEADRGRDGIFL